MTALGNAGIDSSEAVSVPSRHDDLMMQALHRSVEVAALDTVLWLSVHPVLS